MPIPRIALILPLVLMGSAALAQAPAMPAGPPLSITFSGMEAKDGPIMMAVYDEAGWKTDTPLLGEMLYPKGGEAHGTIVDLPPGSYGIKAFHDVNRNGKLDTNPFGIPSEPYAFSNNAHGSAGPAKWADASFVLASGGTAQTITIR